jgi:hypothetical protein
MNLALIATNPTGIKSFLLLFFKKEALSSLSKQRRTAMPP